jgi:hypothetical protein
VVDFFYRDDSIDCVFTLILDDFYQSDSHKSRLKSWVFGSRRQLLVARISKKAKTNMPYDLFGCI